MFRPVRVYVKEIKLNSEHTTMNNPVHCENPALLRADDMRKLYYDKGENQMKEFDRIIGYSAEKKELEQIADCLKNREVYESLGVKAPSGLLLHGEPGVGKTLMSNCLIEASGLKAFVCRKNKPNGEFVNEITKTFETAEKNAPCIVFLDDMDKFTNGDEHHRDAEEYVTVQSCIDSVKNKGVFVLATANSLHCLPRSLLRAGRFDRRLVINAPKGKDAIEIISHYLDGKTLAENIDRSYIARLMDGESCAKLETLINEAGIYAGYDRAEKISMSHFMRAYLRDTYGRDCDDGCDDFDDDYCDLTDKLTDTVWHEAGHTVVSEVLYPGSVTLVSVSGSEGSGKGGFTSYCNINALSPLEYSKVRVISSLAGAAVIEQKFGTPCSGASRDYEQAFRAVNEMISSDCVCGLHLHASMFDNSERLNSTIEQTVAAEVQRYYLKAKEIIAKNSEFLEKTALALAQKKLLTTPEIEVIRKKCKIIL